MYNENSVGIGFRVGSLPKVKQLGPGQVPHTPVKFEG